MGASDGGNFEPRDMLAGIFKMQKELADLTFVKNECVDKQGQVLTCDKIIEAVKEGKLGSHQLPNIWLRVMVEAIKHEVEELDEVLPWKYWARDEIGEKKFNDKWSKKNPGAPALPDRESNRKERVNDAAIELIDILHFTIEGLIFLGKTPEEIYNIYFEKWKVNKARQNSDYRVATKTEDDNDHLAKTV